MHPTVYCFDLSHASFSGGRCSDVAALRLSRMVRVEPCPSLGQAAPHPDRGEVCL